MFVNCYIWSSRMLLTLVFTPPLFYYLPPCSLYFIKGTLKYPNLIEISLKSFQWRFPFYPEHWNFFLCSTNLSSCPDSCFKRCFIFLLFLETSKPHYTQMPSCSELLVLCSRPVTKVPGYASLHVKIFTAWVGCESQSPWTVQTQCERKNMKICAPLPVPRL